MNEMIHSASSVHAFLQGGGEVGRLMRDHDWSTSPLGDPETWPQALRSMVSACLNSPVLGAVLWGPDLMMLYNDAYVASLADRHPAALGRPVAEVWGSAWEQVAPDFHRTMETGEGFSQAAVVLPMVRNGKSVVTHWDFTATPIRGEDGGIAGLYNQGFEITERVMAEQARDAAEAELRRLNGRLEREAEERSASLLLFKDIVESASAPICAFDTDYRLIAFNRAHSDEFFRIYGYRVKVGDVFPDLFLPGQAEVMRGFMSRALTGEIFTVVEEFGDPDLEKPSWDVSYSPLRDKDGVLIGAFHYAQDVSAKLRAQAELGETQDALRQAQKMEAVGQLTGGLAHDFNNLIAGISGSLEMTLTRIAQGRHGEVDRYLSAAQASAKRAAALTHRLLAFSRRQTLDPKVTNINGLVTGMEDLIRRTVGPSIDVECVTSGGLWTVSVDANQLENALLNLAINARDAMSEGGKLTIETANRWLDERGAHDREIPPGQYVSMCVSDNGIGMPSDVVAKAFDPFFTTKPIGEGTGLGLSMIYGFVRQSGGQVRIYSEVGQGTMVCLYLPRHLGDEDAIDQTSEVAASPPEPLKAQVLVIDDEPLVRMLIVDVVEDLGCIAMEAADGPSGLKVLQTNATIDLLITDVGLPNGMNGRQVADAARALRPDLKIMFVTGYAENAVLNHGHLEHGMTIVTKPFAMDDLARRVKVVLAGD